MKLISHRGNISGPNDNENKPDYILNTLNLGYDSEIDLWYINNILYLGHDIHQYIIDADFLINDNLWIHCKNIESLEYCVENNIKNNYFFHNTDDVTLTSQGYLWTYPGKKLTKWSVAVMPEIKSFDNITIAYCICSDYINKYNNL